MTERQALSPQLEQIGFGTKFHDELIGMIERIKMFKNFDIKEIEILSGYLQAYQAQHGVVLFREGDRTSHLCLLVEGKLSVNKEVEYGHQKKLADVLPGRSIGEMSVIDGHPYSASVMATEDSILLMLTREKFLALIKGHPALGVKILLSITNLLSQRLRQTSGRLVDFL